MLIFFIVLHMFWIFFGIVGELFGELVGELFGNFFRTFGEYWGTVGDLFHICIYFFFDTFLELSCCSLWSVRPAHAWESSFLLPPFSTTSLIKLLDL